MTTKNNDLFAELDKARKALEDAQDSIKPKLGKVYEAIGKRLPPNVAYIGWNQWTPYFNDGEPCAFGVHEPHFMLFDENGEESGDEMDGWELRDSSDEKIANANIIKSLLSELGNLNASVHDLLQDKFGDGVCVKITKNGIDVVEVDHD